MGPPRSSGWTLLAMLLATHTGVSPLGCRRLATRLVTHLAMHGRIVAMTGSARVRGSATEGRRTGMMMARGGETAAAAAQIGTPGPGERAIWAIRVQTGGSGAVMTSSWGAPETLRTNTFHPSAS